MEQCSTFGLLIYHSSGNTYMMDIPILLLLAALAGAILNVARGYLNTEKAFSPKKFTGAIIAACITAIALVSVFDLSAIGGPVQMVILGLMSGFGSDFALSRLNK